MPPHRPRRPSSSLPAIITGLAPTLTDTGAPIQTAELAASERLAAPIKQRRWRPWAWGAAAFLHVLVIALLFLLLHRRQPAEEQSPPGIAVVFDNGGETQTAAPQTLHQGPPSPALAPPPAAPPPPQTAQNQPEVNLNMPDNPFGEVQSAPAPQAAPPPRPAPHPAPRPHPTQKYLVMNGMSYGSPSPPVPHAQQALNMSLPESDAEAVNAPDLTIKGDIGADWQAALNRWVNEHKYYPQAALEQDQQGAVRIEFTVDRAGNVTGLRLLNSAGSPFLDQAWLGLFADNQLPPFPPGTKANTVTVDATMRFELIGP